ncbi:MAG: hypothetical protein HQL11_01675 [Candidatus Omnitrophica bacterium]|nr:hypothetical protein [Candidatus Omnitrophota bacterium]
MKKCTHMATLPAVVLALLFLGGCGYTYKTHLPDHIRTVFVPKVQNAIDITASVSSSQEYQPYRPGLEIELKNALIERLVFDGHLKIAPAEESSDAVLRLKLLRFERDPVRYRADDTIGEFRIQITASAQFVDRLSGETLWSTESISGNDSYFLTGELAKSEDEAVAAALKDLVRHIVENVIEIW